MRIAQRLGLDNEATFAKCSVLEAEMRRRLWWSLVMFDNRMCEMSHYGSSSLTPIWRCNLPSNLNDADLRGEMREAPKPYDRPTEAIFVAIRCEVGDFIRHSSFHLDLTNPAMKPLARRSQHGAVTEAEEMVMFADMLEDKYIRLCELENPLHFVAAWSTRGFVARIRLLEHYAASSRSTTPVTDEHRDAAVGHALRMLKCDTELMTAPHVKRFVWFAHVHFPAPAYIHIIQDLKKRPLQSQADKCWAAMGSNYEARFKHEHPGMNPFFGILTNIILQAWQVREKALADNDQPLGTSSMVEDIRQKTQRPSGFEQAGDPVSIASRCRNDASFLPDATGCPRLDSATVQNGQPTSSFQTGGYSSMLDQDFDMTYFDWNSMDWNPMLNPGFASPSTNQWP